MRSFIFAFFYYVSTIFFGVLIALAGLIRFGWGARQLSVLYAKSMRFFMHYVAGIKIEYKGKENIPSGPYIIAAKHQSWGDGFALMSFFGDVAFVIGNFIEKIPLASGVMKSVGAIVIDNCGGAKSARDLSKSFDKAATQGRNVLIFPEGHLVPIGSRIKYRSGVYLMQKACNWPIVPVATNLGLFWPEKGYLKESGKVTIQILEPIPSGLAKIELMNRLESALNDTSRQLCEQAQIDHPNLTQSSIKWPEEINMVK